MAHAVALVDELKRVYIYTQIGGRMASSREIIRRLEAAGWRVTRQKGSHVHLRFPGRPGLTTVPHPNHDIKPGTLRSIERQSGVKLR